MEIKHEQQFKSVAGQVRGGVFVCLVACYISSCTFDFRRIPVCYRLMFVHMVEILGRMSASIWGWNQSWSLFCKNNNFFASHNFHPFYSLLLRLLVVLSYLFRNMCRGIVFKIMYVIDWYEMKGECFSFHNSLSQHFRSLFYMLRDTTDFG